MPFPLFILSAAGRPTMAIPLADLASSWPAGETDGKLRKYQKGLEQLIRQQGLDALLDEPRGKELTRASFSLLLEAGELHPQQPAWRSDWTYFYAMTKRGAYGVLPTFPLEAWGSGPEDLETNLKELLREALASLAPDSRMERLLYALWPDDISWEQRELDLRLPELTTGSQIEQPAKDADTILLNEAAGRLQPKAREAFGLEGVLKKLLPRLIQNHGKGSSHILVIGPSGSGKTALIRELIRRFTSSSSKGSARETQASKLLRALSKGTSWEANLPDFLNALNHSKELLFVHHLKDLFEIGQYIGNDISVGETLLNDLPRAQFTLLAECTLEELAWMELRKPGLTQLFYVFRMEDANLDYEHIALEKTRAQAAAHQLEVKEEAVREALALVNRFFPYSGMPGRALRFLESVLMDKLQKKSDGPVDAGSVRTAFSRHSGLPALLLDPAHTMRPAEVKDFFFRSLFGQRLAIERVSDMLIRVKATLVRPDKPMASFLFVGPTGVGKTELAKQLARFIFGSPDRMLRFDMSEYSQYYAVMRLIGGPEPAGGLLTQAIRHQPFCLLLFDEIEKAHPIFFDLLLQILGEARLTESSGKFTEFGSTIIVMTSNLGSEKTRQRSISWQPGRDQEALGAQFEEAVRQAFRPELFNRIDHIIPFFPLDETSVRGLVDRELEHFRERYGFKSRKIELRVKESAMQWFSAGNADHPYGARHLQRMLRKKLFLPLARILNQHDPDDKLFITVEAPAAGASSLHFDVKSEPMPLEHLIDELERTSLTEYSGKLRRKLLEWQKRPSWESITQELKQYTDKLKKGKKFTQKKAGKMSRLQQLDAHFTKLLEEIEEVEESLLQVMILRSGNAETDRIQNRLDQWNKRFLDLLLEVYMIEHPRENQCSLFVAGSKSNALLKIYDRIFEAKGYKRTYHCWWPKATREGEKTKEFTTGIDYASSTADGLEHLLHQLENNPEALAELRLRGPVCNLYISPEEGIHQWEDRKGSSSLNLLMISSVPKPPAAFQRFDPKLVKFDPNLIKEKNISLRKTSTAKIEQFRNIDGEMVQEWRYLLTSSAMDEVLKEHLDGKLQEALLQRL